MNRTVFNRLLVLLGLLLSTALGALEVGDQAPPFSLQATDGKTYSLEQFHNKQAIVIAWYPKAFTSGCTIECKSLAQNGHLLKRLDVTYFMASVDALEDNQAFAEENEADFPLLSDPSKKVAEAYDVLAFYGVPKRHTIYIGKDGKILYVDRNINAATSAEDMAAKLEELGIPARQAS
ncbi:MAG: peroxiredoxin [Porticoccaceae bacterium]